MKISMRDLDPEIIEKLNRLDSVVLNYGGANQDGFISYNNNGFYFKKTNDTFLRKIVSDNEIAELKNGLINPLNSMKSSYYDDFQLTGKNNSATKSLVHSLELYKLTEIETKPLIKKFIDNGYYMIYDALNDQLSKVKLNERCSSEIKTTKVVKPITDNFNLATNLTGYDIVDFIRWDANNYIIATSFYGIYKFVKNEDKFDVELVVNPETRVRKIEKTQNDKLFVAADDFCALYDIESGVSIEKFFNIIKSNQIPLDVIKTENQIFVIGKSLGINNTDNLVHCFELDQAKISFNVVDNQIMPNPDSKAYEIRFIQASNDELKIIGFYYDKIFSWSYDLKTFEITESFISGCNISDIRYIAFYDDLYYILLSDRVETNNGESLVNRYNLTQECKEIKVVSDKLYFISLNGNVLFTSFPEYENKEEEIEFSIYDEMNDCNNIDIFVDGVTKREKITFFDVDKNTQIFPSYYVILNGNSAFIKLTNPRALHIVMKVEISEDSNITGIVINKNKLYLR